MNIRILESKFVLEEGICCVALSFVEAVFFFVEDLLKVRLDTIKSEYPRDAFGHRLHDGTCEWSLV